MGKNLKGKEIGLGISQTKFGTYHARVVCSSGKRLSKSFKKLSEARAWLSEVKYNDAHSNLAASSKMSVDTWFDFWIDKIIGPRLKYGTIVSYRGRYSSRIRPIIGRMALCDVKPLHCQQVLNEAQCAGEVPGSVAKLRSIMHALFDTAVENQLISSSPVTRSVKYIHGKTEKRTILTLSQQEDFLNIGKQYLHYDVFVFILNTGLRCGEMKALRWQDIDWENRMIQINGTMYHNANMHKFEVNTPKTNAGIRTIPLTDEAFDILLERKKSKNDRPISLMYRDFVFVGKEGIPLNDRAYNECLHRIAKQIGVEKLTMHSLRHTFATRCIENGMKPKVLQEILGHASIAMTMDLYVHVTEDEKTSEMKKLSLPKSS